MMSNFDRYQRIAPLYDLLDLPFERRRYQALRPLMFQNLGGRLLDAGIGTGKYAFVFPIPPSLKDGKPHSYRVQVEGSSYKLDFYRDTPRTLTCKP